MKPGRRGFLKGMALAPAVLPAATTMAYPGSSVPQVVGLGKGIAALGLGDADDYDSTGEKSPGKPDLFWDKSRKINAALDAFRESRKEQFHIRDSVRLTYGIDMDIASLRSVSPANKARMQLDRIIQENLEEQAELDALQAKLLPLVDITASEWLENTSSKYLNDGRKLLELALNLTRK